MEERQNNLALYPGATRRQNVACDACRAKKVRCRRLTTAQKCEQCVSKDLECTSNYIEQLQNKPRRPRRFRSNDDRIDVDDDERPLSSAQPSRSNSGPEAESSSNTRKDDLGVQDAMAMIAWMTPPHTTVFVRPSKDAGALQADLLRYLFSPTPVMHHEWRYSDVSAVELARAGACDMSDEDGGAIWDAPGTAAHLSLWASGETGLEAVALELLESYFTIVHTRLPILDAHQFIASFRSPGAEGTTAVSHGLLAVVLAFGAKFTEHASFVADREEASERDGREGSRLVKLLGVRAREVLETIKAHRIPTMENVQALILMEAVAAQSLNLRRHYRAQYLTVAARLLEQIPVTDLSSISVGTDDRTRAMLGLYFVSGFESALFRLRPDAFDWVAMQANPFLKASQSSSEGTVWLSGARVVVSIYHKLAGDLWRPQLAASGVPISTLRDFIHEYSSWRDQYLGKLGLPVPWPDTWDFATTARACCNDIMYHALWLVVDGAVRDYSIQQAPEEAVPGMFALEAAQASERLKSEAMHAAMRIAMLSALATEQGFLRIDPLCLYRPIFDAGMYLARQGLEDCMGCVAGLKQYSGPYPQMLECALDIQRTFISAAPH